MVWNRQGEASEEGRGTLRYIDDGLRELVDSAAKKEVCSKDQAERDNRSTSAVGELEDWIWGTSERIGVVAQGRKLPRIKAKRRGVGFTLI